MTDKQRAAFIEKMRAYDGDMKPLGCFAMIQAR